MLLPQFSHESHVLCWHTMWVTGRPRVISTSVFMIHHNLYFFLNCWRIFKCWFPSHYSTFIMHTMYSTVFSILADLIMSKNSGPNSKMIKCLSWSLPCLHVIVLFHYFGAYMSDSDCSINIINFQNVKNYLYIHIP